MQLCVAAQPHPVFMLPLENETGRDQAYRGAVGGDDFARPEDDPVDEPQDHTKEKDEQH